MSDLNTYITTCCGHRFIGMNHSPEMNGTCRNCGKGFACRPGGFPSDAEFRKRFLEPQDPKVVIDTGFKNGASACYEWIRGRLGL